MLLYCAADLLDALIAGPNPPVEMDEGLDEQLAETSWEGMSSSL